MIKDNLIGNTFTLVFFVLLIWNTVNDFPRYVSFVSLFLDWWENR